MADLSIEQTKTCTKCGQDKPLELFHRHKHGAGGRKGRCKLCIAEDHAARKDPAKIRAATARWRARNPGAGKAYYEKNKAQIRLANNAWRDRNREKVNAQAVERRNQNREIFLAKEAAKRDRNRESYRAATKRFDEKKRATPRGRLENAISAGISGSLARNAKANRKWQSLVGYSLSDLVVHLEGLFTPGMSWDNYGDWHVDHIIPISAFNYEAPDHLDFKRCWALSNLQPLWALDNVRKRDRLLSPFQPSLAL